MDDPIFRKEYSIINSSFIILKGILLGVAMLMKPANNNNQNILPEDKLNADWNANQSLQNLN